MLQVPGTTPPVKAGIARPDLGPGTDGLALKVPQGRQRWVINSRADQPIARPARPPMASPEGVRASITTLVDKEHPGLGHWPASAPTGVLGRARAVLGRIGGACISPAMAQRALYQRVARRPPTHPSWWPLPRSATASTGSLVMAPRSSETKAATCARKASMMGLRHRRRDIDMPRAFGALGLPLSWRWPGVAPAQPKPSGGRGAMRRRLHRWR